MSLYFPKLLSFQPNFGNFGIRLMRFGLFSCQFKTILKKRPMFIPVFALRGHRYTRRLILRPISAVRPWIDLCTKNPPPSRGARLLFTGDWARQLNFICCCERVTSPPQSEPLPSQLSQSPFVHLGWEEQVRVLCLAQEHTLRLPRLNLD